MTNLREYVRLHKIQSLIAAIVIVILFILYGRFYYSIGMRYDDTFFSMKSVNGITFYTGITNRGRTDISVSEPKNNIIDVTYQLEGLPKKTYLVSIEPAGENPYRAVTVTENGAKFFKGLWSGRYLTDESGQVVFDEKVKAITPQGTEYDESGEELTPTEIIRLALHQYDCLRGKPEISFWAILILLLAVFDMMYPLAFFNLFHMLWVEDAKPSDTYLSVQKVKWIILPLISFILFVMALC